MVVLPAPDLPTRAVILLGSIVKLMLFKIGFLDSSYPVSYTHLDVYKRQVRGH